MICGHGHPLGSDELSVLKIVERYQGGSKVAPATPKHHQLKFRPNWGGNKIHGLQYRPQQTPPLDPSFVVLNYQELARKAIFMGAADSSLL